MMASQGSQDGSATARSAWGSLERQLPLFITGLLAVVLLAALALNYVALRRLAIERADDRLAAAADRLGTLGARSTDLLRTRLAANARDTTIVRALVVAGDDDASMLARTISTAAAKATLEGILPASDSALSLELWTDDGRRIAHAGRDLRAADLDTTQAERRSVRVPRDGLEGLQPADTAQFGELYAADGRAYFWTVAPVLADGARVGYLARRFLLRDGDQAEETIRGLTGEDVQAYYRSADDEIWVTLTGAPAPKPDARDSSDAGLRYASARAGEMLAVERRLGNSPLVLVLAQPMRSVLAAATETIRTLALLSLVILIIGALLALALSRRITRPIAALTGAAAALGRGDFDVRVAPAGAQEIAQLGIGFNRMAEEIAASHQELEMQTEEAQATTEELEQSLEELHESQLETERARSEAEAANRAKTEFLTVMSHELRTPLNAIGGYAELMEMGLRGPVTDQQRRDLARIRDSQKHLLGLISAILDLGRIEAGRVSYRMEPVPVDTFVASVAGLVEPQAAAKHLVLAYDPCPPHIAVLADREKLRQILLNLLSNAIRHTASGGRVDIGAEARDHAVAIIVRDTGEGISPDALERIFEPFVQLDRTLTTSRDGIGLGLAISRDLARGMSGELIARSEPGHGASFELTLPAADGARPSGNFSSDELPAVQSPGHPGRS